jgi:hypothetical protein
MTEMVIETAVQYVHRTRLIAREDYIKFTRRESTKTVCFYIVSTSKMKEKTNPRAEIKITFGGL